MEKVYIKKGTMVKSHRFLGKNMKEKYWELGDITIVQGENTLVEVVNIVETLERRNALIVVSKTVSKTREYVSLINKLGEHKIKFSEFQAVTCNPKDTEIMQGIVKCREAKCDIVVGIGGGSILDAAKLIACLSISEGEPLNYEYHQNKKLTCKLQVISIPTTVGTGSEISKNVVITNSKNGEKFRIIDKMLQSDFVILDPVLTLSLSSIQSISGGIDAFAHAFEAYTNRLSSINSNSYYDALALEAMRLIFINMETIIQDPYNIEARRLMQQGAFLAGMVMERDLNANHFLAGVLHRYCPLMNHGIAVGILLPYVMEVNLKACVERYVWVGEVLGIERTNISDLEYGMKFIDEFKAMLIAIQFPILRNYLMHLEDIDSIAHDAYLKLNRNCNPIELDKKDVYNIFYRAFEHI